MRIYFKKLRNKELAALAQRVIDASKEGKYTVMENNELLLEVEKQYAYYYKSYNKPAFSGMGEAVAKADAARDRIFSKTKSFLRGYKGMTIMPNHGDAKALYEVFRKIGLNTNVMSYAEQTAQMKKLIEELEKTENTEKLVSLGITQAFDELKTTQKHFETLYAEQAEANAELRIVPSATAIRSKLEGALRNYFGLLEAMRDLPEWRMIYAEINELVKKA